MDFKEISYEKSDRVAIVSYNRPERMNAWTMRMGEEARQAMLDADRDPQIGAIILTGAGALSAPAPICKASTIWRRAPTNSRTRDGRSRARKSSIRTFVAVFRG